MLALQQRAFEKQAAAAAAAKKTLETKERDPFRFAFEDYHLVDIKSTRAAGSRMFERAMTLPPGEYDIFIGLLDRAREDVEPGDSEADAGRPRFLERSARRQQPDPRQGGDAAEGAARARPPD